MLNQLLLLKVSQDQEESQGKLASDVCHDNCIKTLLQLSTDLLLCKLSEEKAYSHKYKRNFFLIVYKNEDDYLTFWERSIAVLKGNVITTNTFTSHYKHTHTHTPHIHTPHTIDCPNAGWNPYTRCCHQQNLVKMIISYFHVSINSLPTLNFLHQGKPFAYLFSDKDEMKYIPVILKYCISVVSVRFLSLVLSYCTSNNLYALWHVLQELNVI